MTWGDDASIQSSVRAVVERWGTIDVLVNNAVRWGPSGGSPLFEEEPVAQWRDMLRSSLEGIYLTIQEVLPAMRPRGWGRIVKRILQPGGRMPAQVRLHTSRPSPGSTDSRVTLPGPWGPAGILTNVVMPGLTLTERRNRPLPQEVFDDMKRRVCTGRLTESEEVAAAIVFLGSAANGHINGEMVRVDGGM